MTLYFPTESGFSPAEVAARFTLITDRQDPDPALHYQLLVPLAWEWVDLPFRAVTAAEPFALRGHCRAGSAVAEARIFVAYMPEEVAPADWLGLYLDAQGEQVLHQRLLPHEGGAVPDALTRGGTAAQPRLSRWRVLKDHATGGGAHFFLLQASTIAAAYSADLAEAFLLLINYFQLLQPSGWAYAEQLQTLAQVTPATLLTAFPASWAMQENPVSSEQFYQLMLSKSVQGLLIGRLNLLVIAGQTEADLRRLEQEDRALLASEGTVFEPVQLVAAPPLGNLSQTFTATMPQTNAAPGTASQERRVVIGQAGGSEWLAANQVWVYASRVSATRQSGPEGWAITKRAFDILLERLQIY